ncbi:PKD domain-containing protein [Pedobacter aquatilis]|uniref:PKD domain-containing protein n=1 Tax=Pedobacter aquatilis TaxID=351343 RepID=UPI00292CEC69|nr:PKD domain-containing protein [Pedobacter aquatilis]
MQRQTSFYFLVITLLSVPLLFNSCRKAAESAVDCLGQSFYVSFKHNTNDQDPRKVDFNLTYSGKLQVASMRIDYGDGQTQTLSTGIISHTYAAAGTYQVKAWISLQNGKGSCEVNPVRQVIVN